MTCLAGPNLSGLFGRTSGTTAGYTYSKPNKDKAVDWSKKHLYEYLLNPKKVKSQFNPGYVVLWRSLLCQLIVIFQKNEQLR